MQVKIISCHNIKLWYADRIDQVFDVRFYNKKYVILSSPIFSINPIDAEVVTKVRNQLIKADKKVSIRDRIISLLHYNNLSVGQIHLAYKNEHGYIELSSIRYTINFLITKKIIVGTGEKVRYQHFSKSKIYKLNL